MIQKRLSGQLMRWNPRTQILHLQFRKWWETGRYTKVSVPFVLDPYALVTSAYGGTLGFSELRVGQRLTIRYVTGPSGQPLAKAVVVSETAKGSTRYLGTAGEDPTTRREE